MMDKRLRLRARWWVAALALAACAPTARGKEHVHARCAPEAGDTCQQMENEEMFLIHGRLRFFDYDNNGDICVLNCAHIGLDDVAWPRFMSLVACPVVSLEHCALPPGASYVDALRALNVSATEQLILIMIPPDAQLSAASLRGAPRNLHLHVEEGELLELVPGALRDSADLRVLKLTRVRADVLPEHLSELVVEGGGMEVLPPNALSVEKLQIEDEKLLTLAGTARRLLELKLTAPALESLMLHDTMKQVLSAGFAQKLGRLRALALEQVRGNLTEGFLRGATQLRTFKAVACELTVLPSDLFSYSLELEHIDLSKNSISTLAHGLFSHLKQLKTLLLTKNSLTTRSLTALAPLVWLRELGLSRNLFWDICNPGQPSPLASLQQLRSLHLARSAVLRICSDWLRDMPALADLDLRNNDIVSLSCAELRAVRTATEGGARIDLDGNRVERAHCSKEVYTSAKADVVDTQEVTMVLSSRQACSCEGAWFAKVLKERRIAVEPLGKGWSQEFCSPDHYNSLGCPNVLDVD